MIKKKPKKTTEPIYQSVGARIREARLAEGMTQVAFAKFLNVTFQQIQKYEKGQNRVSLFQLIKIARKLKFDIGDFLNELKGGEDEVTHLNTVQLIRAYRKLDKEDQEVIFSTVSVMANNSD